MCGQSAGPQTAVEAGDGGIVGFVTNSGFLDGKSFDGFRKVLAKEFHAIYVYDLRGNQRTSGETSRREEERCLVAAAVQAWPSSCW